MNAAAVLDRLFSKEPSNGRGDLPLWLCLDALYYLAQLYLNQKASAYELVILALLDVFLYAAKDDKEKLQAFHNLPKVFLLHLQEKAILNLLTMALVGLHTFLQMGSNKSVVFFLAITLAIFLSSFGTTRVVGVSFVTGIMASYMYLWESLEPPAQPSTFREDTDSPLKLDQMSVPEDVHVKDHAIAQDLVTKLKRLKVAMIIEQEKSRKSTISRRHHSNRDNGRVGASSTSGHNNRKNINRTRSVDLTYSRDQSQIKTRAIAIKRLTKRMILF